MEKYYFISYDIPGSGSFGKNNMIYLKVKHTNYSNTKI